MHVLFYNTSDCWGSLQWKNIDNDIAAKKYVLAAAELISII
jgi:hypothetical protein